jgi:hypothetical protein
MAVRVMKPWKPPEWPTQRQSPSPPEIVPRP